MTDKSPPRPPLSYEQAGVSIDAGNRLVERIKPIARATQRAGVLGGLGGFGALFEIPLDRYRNPVLVSGTDGVGTKLLLAKKMGKHDTIGIDLVAMCVNDIVVQGAEPLFFLDYYATGKLEVDVAADVIKGIGEGCLQAGAALVGGETAEMPAMYPPGEYDLAGFAVGICDKDKLLDGSQVAAGDVLLALPSSGPHSNGYSLIRKILEVSQADLASPFQGRTLGETLLTPTRIYVKSLLALLQTVPVHSLCHVTGGGLLENPPRVYGEDLAAEFDTGAWSLPPIFQWLQQQGNVERNEMYRTFNCGIGMIITVAPQDQETALQCLRQHGETPLVIGRMIKRPRPEQAVLFR